MKRIGFLITTIYMLIAHVSAEQHHHHEHEHDHGIEFTQQQIHDHGKVVATISYSQSQINLHLGIPAYNAFGFEHTPNNKQEQTLIDNTLKDLSLSSNVVEFQPACIEKSANVVDPHRNLTTTTNQHFDVEIEYIFTCPINEPISILFSLFKTVPSISQIEAQYISDTEQKLITLDPENHTITID